MASTFLLLALGTKVAIATRAVPNYYEDQNELVFRRKVDAALATVQSLLESAKSPRRILSAADVEHGYEDKFFLAEFITNTAVASVANAFDRLGVGSDALFADADTDRVKLRLTANETCTFIDETVVEVSDPSGGTKHETYETSATGETKKVEEKKTTTKVVREVTEYRWKFDVSYELSLAAFEPGSNAPKSARTILSRSVEEDIVVVGSERAPCQEHYSPPALEVELGWFLGQLRGMGEGGEAQRSQFRIERDAASCKTPRRNDDVEEAAEWFGELERWGRGVAVYFQNAIVNRIIPRYYAASRRGTQEGNEEVDRLRSIDDSAIFVPVLTLFQEDGSNGGGAEGPALTGSDVDLLLGEQLRTVDEALVLLGEKFPTQEGAGIASIVEAQLILLAKHLASISKSLEEGVSYVEGMLRSQLVSAVGREISESDFDEFIISFYPKLFREEYVPESFVYAVRRPDHSPDGTLSLEATSSGSGSFDPILTSTRRIESPTVMSMPINAATSIQLGGEQHLHAWVRNEFGRVSRSQARLVARARQFSSFLLCIGTISGPNTFQPKHAIILQNKDEVYIPLLLEPLPTPKEFTDSIKSLSPEQQDFAKAFRTMQLESSVFALAVVQLKPQLEEVLNLPVDSLTKEIKLTQNLLEQFIEYQIPPDLLSYDGNKDAPIDEKLSRVKENVAAVQGMIDEAKEREVKDAELRADLKAGGEERRRASGHQQMTYQKMAYHAMADDEVMVEAAMMADEMPGRIASDDMQRAMMAEAMPEMEMMASATPRHMRAAASSSLPSSDGAAEHHLRATGAGQASGSDGRRVDEGDAATEAIGNAVDYSTVAKKLDAAFDEYDTDSALRPTKILLQDSAWEKNFQKTLLTAREKAFISEEEKKREKDKAFDLLDALSKSGARTIYSSELHVVVAATHRFDYSLIDTVIRSNVNPIASVERSALIVSSTIHDVPVEELVLGQRRPLIEQHSPSLLAMGREEMVDKREESEENAEAAVQ